MRRRRWLWFFALPPALLFGVMLVLPLLVSGDALRELVIDSIVDMTGAEVELGAAEVRVLPRLAVRLEQGRIAGTGAALAARSGTETDLVDYTAEIAHVDLRMALRPLLAGEIEVTAVRIDVPRLTVTLPADRIVLEGGVLRIHDLQMGLSRAEPGANAPPAELIPADLSCRADLAVEKLTTGGADYDRVTAEATLAGRVVEVAPIRAGRGGGRLSGAATLDYAADPWGKLMFEFAAEDVPAADLLAPWAPDLGERLVADLQAEGRGGCRLQDAEVARATLDLAGTITAGDGVLHAGDWMQDVLPYLGERRDLVDVHFRRLDHTFRVAGERYLVDKLAIDGLDTAWRGAGWVGLDDTIGLDLAVKLPPGFTPDLGAMSFLANTLRDEEGRVRLDLKLTGRASKPKVGLNLAALKASRR